MPKRIVRYRVRREAGLCLVVDTLTKLVVQQHTDPTEAHQAAGTLNYQHRLALIRKHRLQGGKYRNPS
jgi:hypothetical protein